MRLAAIALLAILAGACATSASTDASSAAAAQEGKVCKRQMATGSNMPQNVCHTKEEWAAIEKQGREGVEEFERERSVLNPFGVQ